MQENKTLIIQIDKLFQKALDFHKQGDLENAILWYQQAANADPLRFSVYYNMSVAQSILGKIDEAIRSLNNAIYAYPNDAKAHWDLGNLYVRKSMGAEALLCYVRAIKIKPEFSDAHNNLDALLNRIEDSQVWLSTFKILFEQNPNMADVGPQRIRIETSSACNLRCQHCPTGVDYKSTDRAIMSMGTFDKLIDQIKQLKIVHDCVLYLGGEPLMNKKFPTMCKRIKEETSITRTLFNTNAMLLTEEICKELSMAKVDQIGISIDGRSPEENDQIRKGSDYSTVLENTKMLKRFLPNSQISISNTQTKHPGDPEPAEIPEFLCRDFSGYTIEASYAMEWPGLDINKSIFKNIAVASNLKKNFCRRPFTEMAVRPNGDVTLCCYDITGQYVVGNIHDSDLLSIWKGKAYTALRNNLISQKLSALPNVCKKCVYFTGHTPMTKN